MKARILLIIFILLSVHVIGQETNETNVKSEPQRNNVIKFLPGNLVFNSLSFEYERKFSPKSSFTVGVGFSSPKSFADKFNLSSNDNRISNDEFGVMSVRAAYRLYAGHHVRPVGFYFSPYFKYQKFTAKADNYRTITDNSIYPPIKQSFNEKYDVSGNTLNFGLQWGVQFLIAKRVSIDFYFLGIEGGVADVTATVKSPDVNFINSVETGVMDNVNSLPSFFADKITITKSADKVDVKGSSMPYPWLRTGISIGIAF